MTRREDPWAAELRLAMRRDILAKYARLTDQGRPMTCMPSAAELAGDVRRKAGPRTDGKIIYDSRANAEACARELETTGSRPQRAVPCRRSRHGHFHLTTDNPRRSRR